MRLLESEQDRISFSFYNIKQTSNESKEKYQLISIWRLFSGLQPNYPNEHHKNCITDRKENYLLDLGSERVERYSLGWCLICMLKIYLKD